MGKSKNNLSDLDNKTYKSNITKKKNNLVKKSDLTETEKAQLKILKNFYRKCAKKEIYRMIKIIEGESSSISLRLLEWFVTKYSKKNLMVKNMEECFDIYIDYKSELLSYNKIYFDPFRRKKKFIHKFILEKNIIKKIKTTIGQLQFFRWAIQNKIIDYVEEKREELEKEMALSNKYDKPKSKNKNNSDDEDEFDKSGFFLEF